MIYYTIKAAQGAKLVDRIIVSTDDQEIKDVSLSLGAEVPFIRPEKYSHDHAGDLDVLYHFLKWWGHQEDALPKMIVYLRPDFPFRESRKLDEAIKLYCDNPEVDGLRSVQPSKEMPYKTWKVESGYLKMVVGHGDIQDPHNTSRQLFPETFWPIGYVDIFAPELIMESKRVTGTNMIPFVIEGPTVNVGSFEELQVAEEFLASRRVVE